MKILAIDPGPVQSGWVYYDTETKLPLFFGIDTTRELISRMDPARAIDQLVIEKVGTQQQNMAGDPVFETCVSIGRFVEAFNRDADVCRDLTRSAVIIHLHGFQRRKRADGTWFKVKDKHINALIRERYGGQEKAIGGVRCPKCKGKGWFGAGRPVCPACGGNKWLHPPGPLFGIASHAYDAIALAITWSEQKSKS